MDDQEYLREQIYNSLNLRETEELIEIWQTHNSEEWTDLAFEVVKDILRTRLGELPPQEDTAQDQTEITDENTEAEPPDGKRFSHPEKHLICPYCQNDNVLARVVELRNRTAEVVLQKPEIDLPRFLGTDREYDEIVAFACEDCGYVFFMLKDFV